MSKFLLTLFFLLFFYTVFGQQRNIEDSLFRYIVAKEEIDTNSTSEIKNNVRDLFCISELEDTTKRISINNGIYEFRFCIITHTKVYIAIKYISGFKILNMNSFEDGIADIDEFFIRYKGDYTLREKKKYLMKVCDIYIYNESVDSDIYYLK